MKNVIRKEEEDSSMNLYFYPQYKFFLTTNDKSIVEINRSVIILKTHYTNGY